MQGFEALMMPKIEHFPESQWLKPLNLLGLFWRGDNILGCKAGQAFRVGDRAIRFKQNFDI